MNEYEEYEETYSQEEINLISLGKSYYENEKYEDTIDIFLELINLNPDNYEGWHYLGMSYAQIKEYEKAIGFLLKAIEYNPEEELNWCWLGYSYNENEQ